MIIRVLFCVVIIFSYSLCQTKRKIEEGVEWQENTQKVIEKWYGKKIILPQNVTLVNSSIKKEDYYKSPLKVISFIDVTCGACILDLEYWKIFINKVKKVNIDCKFIFYLSGQDVNDIEKLLNELEFRHSWFLDKESEFVYLNKIYDKRFQSLLLKNDSIVLIGNPVLNKELSELYFNTIKSME